MKVSRREMLIAGGLLPVFKLGRPREVAAQKETNKEGFMNGKKDVCDCVIVGGAAALSAATTSGRARRRVLVCDASNPRNAPAQHAHDFFTHDGTPPRELLRNAREQLKPYSTVEF